MFGGCGVCRKKFCEEKQLGIESITETVGMPRIEDNEKMGCHYQQTPKRKR